MRQFARSPTRRRLTESAYEFGQHNLLAVLAGGGLEAVAALAAVGGVAEGDPNLEVLRSALQLVMGLGLDGMRRGARQHIYLKTCDRSSGGFDLSFLRAFELTRGEASAAGAFRAALSEAQRTGAGSGLGRFRSTSARPERESPRGTTRAQSHYPRGRIDLGVVAREVGRVIDQRERERRATNSDRDGYRPRDGHDGRTGARGRERSRDNSPARDGDRGGRTSRPDRNRQ